MLLKIRNYFRTLFSLVNIQLKNKTSLSFKNNKISFIIRLFVYLALFAGLTVGSYFLFKLFQDDSIFGIMVLPIYFFNFLFITIFILILITSIFRFKTDLYFAPDNQFLLTLPVSKNQMFLSKVIVSYCIDFFRNLLFLAPIFISYGYLNNFAGSYYPWLLFCLIFVLMIPVCVGSILSIIIFNIQLWLRKNNGIKNILILVIILSLFVGLIVLCTYMPKEIRIDEKWQTVILPKLKDFVINYENICYPITCISMLLLGFTSSSQSPYMLPTISKYTWIIFLVIIGFIALCMLINLLFLKRYFISTISRGSEHTKVTKNLTYKYNRSAISNKGLFIYKDKKELSDEEYETLINEIYELEPLLFSKGNKDISYFEEFIKKNFKGYTLKLEDVSNNNCLGILRYSKYTRLVLIKSVSNNVVSCYDPFRFEIKNKKTSGLEASIRKNVIHDCRNTYDLFINAVVVFVPSVCIFAVNSLFSALRLTVLGGQLVFAFTIFAILLFITFYASIASSLYSKSQKNAYVLNVSPSSRLMNISTGLLHLFVIGGLSIILIVINYGYTSPLKDINYVCLIFTLLNVFALLLIVNASIDLVSLRNHNFTAKTSEKAGDQNELYAFISSLLISVVIAGLAFLFYRFSKENASLYLMIVTFGLLLIYSLILVIVNKSHKKKKERAAL